MNLDLIIHKITPTKLSIVLSLAAISIVFGIFIYGVTFGVIVMTLFVVLPMAALVVVYPKFGIIVLLISCYLIMWFIRMGVNFPLGTVIDGLQFLLIIGFFIYQKIQPNWRIFKNPITLIIIIWIAYNLLEVANPVAESKLAWLYTIRSVAVFMLMYFIFMFNIRSIKFIRLIFKIWMALSIFSALYALKQEYIGFFQFEETYLKSDPGIMDLLFIGGHWRKFSIFSDPVAFSFNMAISAIFCLIMMTAEIKLYQKWLFSAMAILFVVSMVYSGTRAAYVLIPLGLFFLTVLKLNKKLIIISIFTLFTFLVIINVPTTNYTLYRFQTAFKPSDDPSFSLRENNQKLIQPFIRSHPFGGGLGATGTWGERFAPNSYLAKFPPDSGYTRVAVELGFVGLFIFCTLMFIILKTGIQNYYRIKDPELKTYCLLSTIIVFVLHIANYPQEALVQFPISIYFYLFVALINVTYQMDREKNDEISLY